MKNYIDEVAVTLIILAGLLLIGWGFYDHEVNHRYSRISKPPVPIKDPNEIKLRYDICEVTNGAERNSEAATRNDSAVATGRET